MRRTIPLLILASAFPANAAPASGQAVVDEGTFTITVEGRRAGTETFVIRRVGSGADVTIMAQGRVEVETPGGALTMEPVLVASETFSLGGYQNRIAGAREETFRVEATGDRRFQGTTVSPRGEQVQEYRAASGTILLEDWVAHHYFLLGARMDGGDGTVPVIVPGQGRQLQLQYTTVGSETLQIGGMPVEARKVRIQLGDHLREVWFDPRGRVLRVEDAARGYRAERTTRPG